MGILIAKCFVTDGSGEEHKVIDSNGFVCAISNTSLGIHLFSIF